MACLAYAARDPRLGTRSMTSEVKWNRSSSLRTTMSKGVVVGAHAALSLGRQFFQLRLEFAASVKQFIGSITPHPLFEQLEVLGLGRQLGQGNLV